MNANAAQRGKYGENLGRSIGGGPSSESGKTDRGGAGTQAPRRTSARGRTLAAEILRMILKRLYSARGSDGQQYEVHVYAEPAGDVAHHAHAAPVEKLCKICTATGQELRVLGHGRYQIVESGVTLTASDPQAI
jgi:hypothetical protein